MPSLVLIVLGIPFWTAAGYETPSYRVAVETDVVYGKAMIRIPTPSAKLHMINLLMDVYLPEDCDDTKKPVLLMIHGGGFKNGDKADAPFVRMGQFFASRGFACFSINYRMMGDNPPSPEQAGDNPQIQAAYAAMVDAKRAIRHIRANHAKYGIDPNRIAALGGSAGAVTVLSVGVSDPGDFSIDGPADPAASLNHPEESGALQAIIDCWGTADLFLDKFDAHDPPIMIVHGTDDQNVNTPFEAAQRIRAKCGEAGIPCVFYPIQGAGHGAWDAVYEGKGIEQLTLEFLKKHLLGS